MAQKPTKIVNKTRKKYFLPCVEGWVPWIISWVMSWSRPRVACTSSSQLSDIRSSRHFGSFKNSFLRNSWFFHCFFSISSALVYSTTVVMNEIVWTRSPVSLTAKRAALSRYSTFESGGQAPPIPPTKLTRQQQYVHALAEAKRARPQLGFSQCFFVQLCWQPSWRAELKVRACATQFFTK